MLKKKLSLVTRRRTSLLVVALMHSLRMQTRSNEHYEALAPYRLWRVPSLIPSVSAASAHVGAVAAGPLIAAGPLAAPVAPAIGGIGPAAALPNDTAVAAPVTPTPVAPMVVLPNATAVDSPAPVEVPDMTAAAPIQDTSIAVGPAGTTDSGLDPPDQAGESLAAFWCF